MTYHPGIDKIMNFKWHFKYQPSCGAFMCYIKISAKKLSSRMPPLTDFQRSRLWASFLPAFPFTKVLQVINSSSHCALSKFYFQFSLSFSSNHVILYSLRFSFPLFILPDPVTSTPRGIKKHNSVNIYLTSLWSHMEILTLRLVPHPK